MKVIILIPVWQRLEITEFCYLSLRESIKHAAQHGISITPLIIASEQEHKDLADSYNYPWLYAKNTSVSDKLNIGLSAALPVKSDYITVMGSDNKLLPGIWPLIEQEMSKGTPFFGWSEVRFINVHTNDHINAEYPCTTGVARFHRTDILRKIAKRYKVSILETHIHGDQSYSFGDVAIVSKPNSLMHVLEENIGIWTPGMMTGMDMDSEAYINRAGYHIKHMRGQFIYDFKSEVNLTSWEEISNNLNTISYAEYQEE
jgi:hypothetical protein